MDMYFSSQLKFQEVYKLQIATVMMSTSKLKKKPHHIFVWFVVDAVLKVVFFSLSNLWMSNRFQHFKEAGMKKRNIYLQSKQFSIIYPHSYRYSKYSFV